MPSILFASTPREIEARIQSPVEVLIHEALKISDAIQHRHEQNLYPGNFKVVTIDSYCGRVIVHQSYYNRMTCNADEVIYPQDYSPAACLAAILNYTGHCLPLVRPINFVVATKADPFRAAYILDKALEALDFNTDQREEVLVFLSVAREKNCQIEEVLKAYTQSLR